jgi:DNA-binding PadR family transcriptional regulator
LYPALIKLEHEGHIRSAWGVSDTNRRAKYYELTRSGRRHVTRATEEWQQTTELLARFLSPDES